MPKVYVTKSFGFEAAHHLVGYEGDCARMHGHSYKMQVTVSRHLDNHVSNIAQECMVIDFKLLKKIVEECVIKTHDHTLLNDLYGNPTAEVMVVKMYYTILKKLPKDVQLESVKLWETEGAFAEYRGEM